LVKKRDVHRHVELRNSGDVIATSGFNKLLYGKVKNRRSNCKLRRCWNTSKGIDVYRVNAGTSGDGKCPNRDRDVSYKGSIGGNRE